MLLRLPSSIALLRAAPALRDAEIDFQMAARRVPAASRRAREERRRSARIRREGNLQRVGSFIVRNHNHNRNISGAGKKRKIQGAGSRGQSGDTTTPTGQGEMPPCLFKR